MTDFFNHLRDAYGALRDAHGDFSLFALIQGEGQDTWDLIVAAPWLNDELAGYKLVFDELKRFLTVSELLNLSRLEIFTDGGALATSFIDDIHDRIGLIDLRTIFSGVQVVRAYVIRSNSGAARHLTRTKVRPRKTS